MSSKLLIVAVLAAILSAVVAQENAEINEAVTNPAATIQMEGGLVNSENKTDENTTDFMHTIIIIDDPWYVQMACWLFMCDDDSNSTSGENMAALDPNATDLEDQILVMELIEDVGSTNGTDDEELDFCTYSPLWFFWPPCFFIDVEIESNSTEALPPSDSISQEGADTPKDGAAVENPPQNPGNSGDAPKEGTPEVPIPPVEAGITIEASPNGNTPPTKK